jgi:hypothetical protein
MVGHAASTISGFVQSGAFLVNQPHVLALALHGQAIAAIFDFVYHSRPVGTLVPRVGRHESKALFRMRIT